MSAVSQTQGEKNPFLIGLGDRVRKARLEIGLTRKALALGSGTSERYLAQIESGTGNPSVLVLRQIAIATKKPISFFIEDSFSTQQLFTKKQNRIALIGLRGAGKSTLGKCVASRLGLTFVELTNEIETQSGLAIPEIFSLYGESGYRELEAEALRRVISNHSSLLVAVAGGITESAGAFNILLTHFYTAWLKASPDEHMQRVLAQGDQRPIQGFPMAMTALKRILTSREPDYARADIKIDTQDKALSDCAEELETALRYFLRWSNHDEPALNECTDQIRYGKAK